MNPLLVKEAAGQGLLTVAAIRSIFLNAETILNMNNMFLDELRARVAAWSDVQLIGDVFKKFVCH